MIKKEKKIMPKEQLKLGTTMDGKDGIALFIAESLDVEIKDGIIDFSSNKEFLDILDSQKKTNFS